MYGGPPKSASVFCARRFARSAEMSICSDAMKRSRGVSRLFARGVLRCGPRDVVRCCARALWERWDVGGRGVSTGLREARGDPSTSYRLLSRWASGGGNAAAAGTARTEPSAGLAVTLARRASYTSYAGSMAGRRPVRDQSAGIEKHLLPRCCVRRRRPHTRNGRGRAAFGVWRGDARLRLRRHWESL